MIGHLKQVDHHISYDDDDDYSNNNNNNNNNLCQSMWCSRTCRSQEIIEILISSKLTHLPTSGSGDSWTHKLHRHFISHRAGTQTDRCIERLTWNHAPLSTSLTGGPALQFGIVQGYLFGPHQIGLVPLQLTMFLTFLFLTPGIFTTVGIK